MKEIAKALLGALLCGAFAFLLLWQAVPDWACWLGSGLSALVGGGLFGARGHSHGGVLHIDQIAQRSGLGDVAPGCKLAGSLAALVLWVVSASPWPPLAALCCLAWLTVKAGKTPLGRYVDLLLLPASFVALSSLVLLLDRSPVPQGLLDLPLPGGLGYLSATQAGRQQAVLTACRAMGGVGCLYFLSLTTPMHEIMEALRRLRVPQVVIELMVLVYRFLFVLLDRQQRRSTAADARLGYQGLGRSLRTYGQVSAGLLADAFRRASQCYDAMEARCYDGQMRFLTQHKPLRARHAAVACSGVALLGLLVWLSPGRWSL